MERGGRREEGEESGRGGEGKEGGREDLAEDLPIQKSVKGEGRLDLTKWQPPRRLRIEKTMTCVCVGGGGGGRRKKKDKKGEGGGGEQRRREEEEEEVVVVMVVAVWTETGWWRRGARVRFPSIKRRE